MKTLIAILLLTSISLSQNKLTSPLISIDSSNNVSITKGWKKITIEYYDNRRYTLELPEEKPKRPSFWFIDSGFALPKYNGIYNMPNSITY